MYLDAAATNSNPSYIAYSLKGKRMMYKMVSTTMYLQSSKPILVYHILKKPNDVYDKGQIIGQIVILYDTIFIPE